MPKLGTYPLGAVTQGHYVCEPKISVRGARPQSVHALLTYQVHPAWPNPLSFQHEQESEDSDDWCMVDTCVRRCCAFSEMFASSWRSRRMFSREDERSKTILAKQISLRPHPTSSLQSLYQWLQIDFSPAAPNRPNYFQAHPLDAFEMLLEIEGQLRPVK